MKKLFTLIITLFALTALVSAQSGSCGDNLTWSYDAATHQLTISGSGDMYSYTKPQDVPWASLCEEIQSVALPRELTSIGQYAFYKCTSLTKIEIYENVASIGNLAFALCSSLEEIYCYRQLPPTVQMMTFYGVDQNNIVLHVPAESVDPYSNAAIWSGLSGNITAIPNETPSTALRQVAGDSANGTRKVVEPDGKVYIIMPNGIKYSANGARVR